MPQDSLIDHGIAHALTQLQLTLFTIVHMWQSINQEERYALLQSSNAYNCHLVQYLN